MAVRDYHHEKSLTKQCIALIEEGREIGLSWMHHHLPSALFTLQQSNPSREKERDSLQTSAQQTALLCSCHERDVEKTSFIPQKNKTKAFKMQTTPQSSFFFLPFFILEGANFRALQLINNNKYQSYHKLQVKIYLTQIPHLVYCYYRIEQQVNYYH